MTASIQTKNERYYIVLNWMEGSKRKQKWVKTEYSVGGNGIGLKTLRIYGENLLHVVLGTDYGVHEFVCGNGEYILNHLVLRNLNPNIGYLDPDTGTLERVSVHAVYENLGGEILITLRHDDTCHVQRWRIGNGKLKISLHVGDLPEREFVLDEIKKEAPH